MTDFTHSIAVVIGIDEYRNGISKLHNAARDAAKLGEVLKEEHGYEVWLRTNEEATSEKLGDLLDRELPNAVGPDDRVLFYFAGHGVATDSDDGPAGYLLPQNASTENDGSFLRMVRLHDALASLRCRHLLVILDCCFAGAFRWSSTRSLEPQLQVVYQERFARYVADPAWQVITSAAYDELAEDRRGAGDHSPFASALFDALRGAGDVFPPGENDRPAGDGVITATELYLYLRHRMETLPGGSAQQVPNFWPLKKHGKGEFVFLNPRRDLNLPPAEALTLFNNPYRGLKSYEEKHRELFFGRAKVEKSLHAKVLGDVLTVVVGASGTGKSSLVHAGLIPRLRQLGEGRWHIPSSPAGTEGLTQNALTLRPGGTPLQALTEFVNSDAELASLHSALGLDFHTDAAALAKLLTAWCEGRPKGKLLLIVDQLEELVTMCRRREEREQFLRLLDEAAKELPARLRLVLTIRSDFESQFLRYPLAERWRAARFLIPPMTQDELREAIEGPAAARVIYFEPPSLVDQLINEVVQMPGALPLLSFTLSEMYIRHVQRGSDDRALTVADYESLGGVVGSLRRRANEEYERLDGAAQQDTMRRVLLRMVALEGNEMARRRVLRSELLYDDGAENDRVDTVVRQLTDARLVVEGDDSGGEPYIEPAHDALVRGWDLLWEWVQQEQQQQDDLLLQRRLTQAAHDWDRGGRKLGQLWSDDPRLPLLEQKIRRQRLWLNKLESTFVMLGVRHRKSKRRRRTAWVLASLAVLSATTLFAVFQAVQASTSRDEAIRQRNEALEARREADAQRDQAVAARNDANSEQERANREKERAQRAKGQASQERDRAVSAERQTASERDRAQSQLADSRYAAAQVQTEMRNDASRALLLVSQAMEAAPEGYARQDILRARARYLSTRVPRTVVQLPGLIVGANFSPNQDKVLIRYNDQTFRMWDTRTGEEHPTPLVGPQWHQSNAIVFSGDGRRVAVMLKEIESGKASRVTLRAWEVLTGRPLLSVSFEPTVELKPIVPADSGEMARRLALGSPLGGDGNFARISNDGTPAEVGFSADGRFLVTNATPPSETDIAKRDIQVWSLDTGRAQPLQARINSDFQFRSTKLPWPRIVIDFIKHPHDSINLSPAPRANWMVALTKPAAGDYVAQVVEVETGLPLAGSRPMRHAEPIAQVKFSPDAEVLATVSGVEQKPHFELRLWRAKTGEPIALPSRMEDDQFFTIKAFSADGRKILTVRIDKGARVWDTVTGTSKTIDLQPEEWVNGLAFGRDGNTVVAVAADSVVRVIGTSSGDLEAEPLRLPAAVAGILPSKDDFIILPNSGIVNVLSADGTLRSWNVEAGAGGMQSVRLRQAGPAGGAVRLSFAAFTPEGVLGQSQLSDRTEIQLWDWRTGEPLWPRPLSFPSRYTTKFSISPDGRHFVTAYNLERLPHYHGRAFIQMWETRTGAPKWEQPVVIEGDNLISALAFTNGGRRVTATWGELTERSAKFQGPSDLKARQWDVITGEPVQAQPIKLDIGILGFIGDGTQYITGDFISGRELRIGDINDPSVSHVMRFGEANSGLSFKQVIPLLGQARRVRIVKGVGVVAELPSATFLIRTSADGTTLENLSTNSLVAISGASAPDLRVYSSDGRWALSANHFGERYRGDISDAYVRNVSLSVIETSTGQPLWDFMWHESYILTAAFTADNRRLVTVTHTGVLRFLTFNPDYPHGPSWLTDIGTALTGTRLLNERTAERIPQKSYTELRENFFLNLRRDSGRSEWACLVLSQFEPRPCPVPGN